MVIPAAKIVFSDEDREFLRPCFDEILASGQLILGKYTKQFESFFASAIGVKYAVAVSGGTSALEIICRCLNLAGSNVVVPTNTFFATPAAVLHAGANVVFVDCDGNLQISFKDFTRAIELYKPKAVIVVHIGGVITPRLPDIREICSLKNIFLIEDAAHAHGSSFNGQFAGSFGEAAAFSFFPTKVITAGEGGMIVTNNEALAERARVFRDQGKRKGAGNVHDELGYNWRISEFHAAVGLRHLSHLQEFVTERQTIASWYDELLPKNLFCQMSIPDGVKSNFYKYIVLNNYSNRDLVKSRLKNNWQVSLSGEVYELPCHEQPVFKNHPNCFCSEIVLASYLCQHHLCLPVYQGMTRNETERVVCGLKEEMK